MAFFKTTKIKYETLDPAINNFLGEFNFTCGEFFVQLPFPCFFLLSAATLKKNILRNILFSFLFGIIMLNSRVVQM